MRKRRRGNAATNNDSTPNISPNADGSGITVPVVETEKLESVIPLPPAVTGERMPITSNVEISVSNETVFADSPPNETAKSKPDDVLVKSSLTA